MFAGGAVGEALVEAEPDGGRVVERAEGQVAGGADERFAPLVEGVRPAAPFLAPGQQRAARLRHGGEDLVRLRAREVLGSGVGGAVGPAGARGRGVHAYSLRESGRGSGRQRTVGPGRPRAGRKNATPTRPGGFRGQCRRTGPDGR
ncbi:hypothetical protein Sgou_52490 [Streptomyces gougerotii]|uniref:Uncharacterized protein n=1 Tax=Streptomyces gougerotii TaxID=53448 RepID=A0ABQ1DDE8_9ACTN|nr:hypothetical protein Sgou_52490 [Streptomyces gougerotii]